MSEPDVEHANYLLRVPDRDAFPRVSTPSDAAICPVCKGTGFIMQDLPLGHPQFGKAVRCKCRESEDVNHRLAMIQSNSGLDAVQNMTFATFHPEGQGLPADKASNLKAAFNTCVEYAYEPHGWIILSGTYGCGKTHLAAAIANARIEVGEPAVFMVVPDLLDYLRGAYSPNSEVSFDSVFDQLRNTHLLILDDFGSQSSTQWAQEKLFQLLNHRFNMRLPTVITTNLRLDSIEPRLRSRLYEPDLVVHVAISAPDFRKGDSLVEDEFSIFGLHMRQRFDNFDIKRSDLPAEQRYDLENVVKICKQYAEQAYRTWLVLAGKYGCGKTHLAAAIANSRIERGQTEVLFVSAPELLDHLRATYSPQSSISYDRRFDAIKRVQLLIIDDLGLESATPWAREKLHQLLSYRYDVPLSTVITIRDQEKIDPWVLSRMEDTERCIYLEIKVDTYRGSKVQKERHAGRHIKNAK